MLQQVFDEVKKYGYNTRVYNPDKGLENWNTIKIILAESTELGKWNSQVKDMYNFMKEDLGIFEQECDIPSPLFDLSSEKRHSIWEHHHFYLQHVRIPTLNFESPQLVRLIQIAYNAGQLDASWHNSEIYTDKIKAYYVAENLNNMETYMDKENLANIESSLPKNLLERIQYLCFTLSL